MLTWCKEASISLSTHDSQVKEVFPFPLNRWGNQIWKHCMETNLGKKLNWQRCNSKSDSLDFRFYLDLLMLRLLKKNKITSTWGSSIKWLNWIVLKIENNMTGSNWKKSFLSAWFIQTATVCSIILITWDTVSRATFSRTIRHCQLKRWH